MRILGIDSSGLVASCALLEEDVLLGEYTTNFKKTHSETLMPMIDTLLTQLGAPKSSIDYVAVAEGPGSFTGLRIGAATAKGICKALSIPLIPVPTLDAMAYNLWGARDLVCPIMDARRDQTYTAVYAFGNGGFDRKYGPAAVAITELAEQLNAYAQAVVFTGDGIDKFKEELKTLLRVGFSFAPANQNRQRAGSVAACGRELLREGKAMKGDEFAPN